MTQEEFISQLAKLIRKYVKSNKDEFEEGVDYDFEFNEILGREFFDIEGNITFSFSTEAGLREEGYID